MKRIFLLWAVLIWTSSVLFAQPDRWQQAIDYKMEIDFDVKTHQFTGTQKAVYTNNSPDELTHVFYHLYFNAFQPGSMMDLRNQQLPDSIEESPEELVSLKKMRLATTK